MKTSSVIISLKCILSITVILFLFFLKTSRALALSLSASCRNTADYGSCWIDTNRTNCAYVIDSDTGNIDNQNVFCNTGNLGKLCKYTIAPIICKHETNNPVQDAVLNISSKNKALSPARIQWEVFLEPGEFPVGTFINSPVRYAVQIPSYTQLSGSLLNNAQKSVIFIPQSAYNAINPICTQTANARGTCVASILMMTNVINQSTPFDKKQFYNANMANPVNNVVIKDLRIIGVDGLNYLNQIIDETRKTLYRQQIPNFSYCSDNHCFYEYTASSAIWGGRLAGGNIKILHNSMELFSGVTIKLSWLFPDISESEMTGGQVNDPFFAYMTADGLPDDHILISDNNFYGSLNAGLISVFGSYMDIDHNSFSGGFNDWVGNQIAVSPWGDSHHISVRNNSIDSFITGVNFEDMLALPNTTLTTFSYDQLYNSPRVARDNVVTGNKMTNVLNCVSVQRQLNFIFRGNTCSFDTAKADRLMNYNYYKPENWAFLEKILGTTLTQKQAQLNNNGIIGVGIFMRSSQSSVIDHNTFTNIPRSIELRSLKLLPGGMKDNRFSGNVFNISSDILSHYRNNAVLQGLSDTFYNLYWPAGDPESSNNNYCSSNSSNFPSERMFNIAPSNQLTVNAICPQVPENSPLGWLDIAECSSIRGWTGDKDDVDKSLTVRFYADRQDEAHFVGSSLANFSRAQAVCDVLGSTRPNCPYGFAFNTPDFLKDGLSHKIYALAQNIPGTSGADKLLLGSPKDLFCNALAPIPTFVLIPGDLNYDSKVDIFDYNLFIPDYGKTGTPGFIPSDIDKNGSVNIFDFNILLGNFGK